MSDGIKAKDGRDKLEIGNEFIKDQKLIGIKNE